MYYMKYLCYQKKILAWWDNLIYPAVLLLIPVIYKQQRDNKKKKKGQLRFTYNKQHQLNL